MQVAVLGTGIMGAGMARSLLRAGLGVRVWNRSRDKAAPLADAGAVVADSAGDAVRGADVVLTMLFDADAAIEVVADTARSFGPDTVWIQSGTVGLDGTKRVGELAADAGIAVLDAPVLGTRKPAEEGALVVLAAGDPALRARVEPVLSAIGSRTVWVGDSLGAATSLKLAVNGWVAALTAATAQSLALAGALGLDPELFLEAIGGGPTDSQYAHVKGAQMLSGQFTPSFTVAGVLKDLGLIRAAIEGAGVDPVLVSALHDAFQRASDAGHAEEDMSAVVTSFRPSLRDPPAEQ